MCFWGSFGFCDTNPPDQVKLQAEYGGLPLSFIKNQGQVDEQVLYYLKGREGTIYFTKSGIVYDLIKKDVGARCAVPEDIGAPVPAPNDDPASAVGAQCVAPSSQETDVGAQHAVPENPESSIQNQTFSRLSFTLKPQGANPDVQVIPQDELPGKVNYFIGNDSTKWHTNIPIFINQSSIRIFTRVLT
jgi:hypothetical protein